MRRSDVGAFCIRLHGVCVHLHDLGDRGVQFMPADKHYWQHDTYILMPSGHFSVEMFMYGGGPESMAVDERIYHVAARALQPCSQRMFSSLPLC